MKNPFGAGILLAVTLAVSAGPGVSQAADQQIVFGPASPCGAACGYWLTDVGYSACQNPFPEGSYFDLVTPPAPQAPAGKTTALVLTITATGDWDSFICGMAADGTHNGSQLAAGSSVKSSCAIAETFSCVERADTLVQAGQRYVLRAYNWVGAPTCDGAWHWEFVDLPD